MTLFIYLHSSRFTFSILAFEFFIHQGHSEFIFIFKSYPIFINLIFENYFPSSLKRRSCLFQIIFVKSGSLIVMNLHWDDLLPFQGSLNLEYWVCSVTKFTRKKTICQKWTVIYFCGQRTYFTKRCRKDQFLFVWLTI